MALKCFVRRWPLGLLNNHNIDSTACTGDIQPAPPQGSNLSSEPFPIPATSIIERFFYWSQKPALQTSLMEHSCLLIGRWHSIYLNMTNILGVARTTSHTSRRMGGQYAAMAWAQREGEWGKKFPYNIAMSPISLHGRHRHKWYDLVSRLPKRGGWLSAWRVQRR